MTFGPLTDGTQNCRDLCTQRVENHCIMNIPDMLSSLEQNDKRQQKHCNTADQSDTWFSSVLVHIQTAEETIHVSVALNNCFHQYSSRLVAQHVGQLTNPCHAWSGLHEACMHQITWPISHTKCMLNQCVSAIPSVQTHCVIITVHHMGGDWPEGAW